MTGPPEQVARSDLRVLVADDDADHRLLLRSLFQRAGVDHVVEAADGREAVQVAVDEAPDLIVLDLAMPARSGIEILPELHDRVPGAQIVVVSNFPRWRLAEAARRRGAVGYVEKRVHPDRLVDEILVAAAMAQRAAERVAATFDAERSAPGEARQFAREIIGEADERLLATVELLISEMVTNAVVHASSAPTVGIQLSQDLVRIEVFDDDPELPRPQNPSVGSRSGRGILLLDRLAAQWGADPHEGGKVVWFELDRRAATA